MAKGNLILGYGSGSIGDVTLARVKGQQTAHARNRKPNNPRTRKQVYQRALFADAVKFFVQGNQAFFKFAFEDKKSNESDYNAFMRNNAKRGVVISKAAYENSGYPALGNFMLTKGSIPPIPHSWDIRDIYIADGMRIVLPTDAESVGNVSAGLISAGLAQAGDIITAVAVEGISQSTIPSVDPTTGSYSTKWNIKQMIVDASSTEPLSKYGFGADIETNEGVNTLNFMSVPDIIKDDSNPAICAVCITRETTTGLKASTAESIGNTAWTNAVNEAREEAYIGNVLASWKTADLTILQGGLVQ